MPPRGYRRFASIAEKGAPMLRHLLRYLKHHHVALLALFLASGGVSYAAAQLPANSVTSRQVKDYSLMKRDFKRGQLPQGPAGAPGPTMGAVAGSAMAPPPQPDKLWENLDLTLSRRGNLWVTAHVESGTLLCADNAPCSVDLGLYVDDQPVAHTDRVLSSDCTGTGCRIHVSEED